LLQDRSRLEYHGPLVRLRGSDDVACSAPGPMHSQSAVHEGQRQDTEVDEVLSGLPGPVASSFRLDQDVRIFLLEIPDLLEADHLHKVVEAVERRFHGLLHQLLFSHKTQLIRN